MGGARVTGRMWADLLDAFPNLQRRSGRNLKSMRAFSAAWLEGPLAQRVIAQSCFFLPFRG